MPQIEEDEYNPSPMLSYQERGDMADFTKWRLETIDIVELLEHDLKGEFFNEKKNVWEVRGTPLLNNDGVSAIVSLVRTSVNKVTFLSNVTLEQIILICQDLNLALVEVLFFEWQVFAVKKEHLDLIVSKVMNFIFMALKKSEGAGERESLYKAESVHRIYRNPEKQGFSLSPFGRGRGDEG